MKLIKIKLSNFRQFYGTQEINFATEDDKNVTLIHGENNGGKTALLNALHWCLYEQTTGNLLEPTKLINKHASMKGVTSFYVSLQVIHDNQIYEIKRTKSTLVGRSTAKNLLVFQIVDGCYVEKEESFPNTLINQMLPKELSEYFFYQGEGSNALNSKNDFSHIEGAINNILGLTVANNTLLHLNAIQSELRKDLSAYDKKGEYTQAIEQEKQISSRLVLNTKELSEIKNQSIIKQQVLDECNLNLERLDKKTLEITLADIDKEKKRIDLFNQQLSREISSKQEKLRSFMQAAFSQRLKAFVISQIDTAELKKTLPYSVDKKLIAEILKKAQCLCGAHIAEDSPSASLITELGQYAVDPDLLTRWNKVSTLHNQLQPMVSPRKALEDIANSIDALEKSLAEANSTLKNLQDTVDSSKEEVIKKLEQQRRITERDLVTLVQREKELTEAIRKDKINLNDIEKNLNKLKSCEPHALKLNKMLNAIEQVRAIYADTVEKSKIGVSQALLKRMQYLFSLVAFSGYSVAMQSLDNKGKAAADFKWVIVDANKQSVAAGNGYQAMLSISFIVALIEFSKQRINAKSHLLTPGTVAPFIADSILAFIGPDNGRELVRYIANSVEQCVFMLSQAQWTESHIDLGIRARIGKEYNLVQHTPLSEDEFKGQYPTRLTVQGQEFDVVRFNSEFDMVTVEEVVLNA
ncbi:MAG: AAA family ATPase [Shewanella sp.]